MRRRQLSRSIVANEPFEERARDERDAVEEPYPEERLSGCSGCVYDYSNVFAFMVILALLPPFLNFAALKRESTALLPKEGEQIDMGCGQKMFIMCIGDGLPTVILEAPTGTASEVWFLIQQKLSKSSKVCVYDRAGLGFSDLPPYNDNFHDPKVENKKFGSQVATLEQMTFDLHHLVTFGKPLPRPFILVGSEIGGLIARHYALTHPEDVVGIVLLNPLNEDLFWRQNEEWDYYWNSKVVPRLGSLEIMAYYGINRIAALLGKLVVDIPNENVPDDIKRTQISHLCNPYHLKTVVHEHLLLNTSFHQMFEAWQTKSFPKNVSVTLINSMKFEKIPPLVELSWQQSQLYLRQSLHPVCQHFITDEKLEKLYEEGILVSETKQLVFRWRVQNDVFPTVHTFKERKIARE
ncbi:uncharacterized protein LOC129230399 [Uloborus diversus]|uniref:uncharacterized protein LOC129230399 n=1 Tax=Uloborus diversus TaxID=327109 RepID=UPI0024094463|nr:uncharacterized protein LOC129230399 [Uloborus diversus]